jgi:L-lactate dehydrogenase complex protein LldF
MWKQAMLHRRFMNMGSSKMKNWVINKFLKDWKKHRGDIEFPKKSFNEMWRAKYGNR